VCAKTLRVPKSYMEKHAIFVLKMAVKTLRG